jgi:hypothetical protein
VREAKVFSYVVQHDTGHAPNPYFRVSALCSCKYRKSPREPKNVVELAEPGDWIVGTGGADLTKSAGHHKLVYAMKVEQKITRGKYFRRPALDGKKPSGKEGGDQSRGENLRPTDQSEDEEQYVLISKKHFYCFGHDAIPTPRDKFSHFEKKGPGFRSDFDADYIKRFEKWIRGITQASAATRASSNPSR